MREIIAVVVPFMVAGGFAGYLTHQYIIEPLQVPEAAKVVPSDARVQPPISCPPGTNAYHVTINGGEGTVVTKDGNEQPGTLKVTATGKVTDRTVIHVILAAQSKPGHDDTPVILSAFSWQDRPEGRELVYWAVPEPLWASKAKLPYILSKDHAKLYACVGETNHG